MKQRYRLLLFLIFRFIGFSQAVNVQLELVDPNVGYPDNVSMGNTSNNDGLNEIFTIHNVIFYGNVNPSELGEPYGLLPYFNRLTCDGCNVADLISDLLA